MAAPGCGEPVVTTHDATRYTAPAAADSGGPCSDIGAVRVCWHADEPVVSARPLPSGPAAMGGWRCGGTGGARLCEERSRNGSAFVCGTQRCLQQRPRMPDDGEWDCVEISGAVFCHSRGELAGLSAGPSDLGWSCAARRGSSSGERICVDLDADRPQGSSAQRCRFESERGAPRRSCVPAQPRAIGSACSAGDACPSGTRCRAGLCLPRAPRPACWLDADCGASATCVFGSCVDAG